MSTTIRNTSGSVSKMIKVAQSYLNNIDKLEYGNSYTAYDENVISLEGKYQIDCSSFANLILHGVTYENSRYNGHIENIVSTYFFNDIDSYMYRYANQIAKYATENNYSFVPNSDFSNIEAGDILFFSWDNASGYFHDQAFMNIDHVGVYLKQKNDNIHTLLQFDTNITSVYYDSTQQYMSQCVLAARFPFSHCENMNNGNLIIKGDKSVAVTNSIKINDYSLTETLEFGKFYTFYVDSSVFTDSCYLVIQVNNETIYSDYGRSVTNGVLTFSFPYNKPPTNKITLCVGGPPEVINRSAEVRWCSLYEGYIVGNEQYIKPLNTFDTYDFLLDESLIADLAPNHAPFYKYSIQGNVMSINFSLPFSSLRIGTLHLGTLNEMHIPLNTQRIPCNLVGENNEAINAILQISSSGAVSIIPYTTLYRWKKALANGIILMY